MMYERTFVQPASMDDVGAHVTQPPDLVKIIWKFELLEAGTPVEEAQFGVYGVIHDQDLSNPQWASNLQTWANAAYDGWVEAAPAGRFATSVRLKETRAIAEDSAGHTQHEQIRTKADSDKWHGTASQSLPWQCSTVVGLYTYTPGTFIAQARSRRGRIYLPPMDASALDDHASGMISPDLAALMNTTVNTFLGHLVGAEITDPVGQGWLPVVLSKTHNVYNLVTDLACDTKIDSQRRREKSLVGVRRTLEFGTP